MGHDYLHHGKSGHHSNAHHGHHGNHGHHSPTHGTSPPRAVSVADESAPRNDADSSYTELQSPAQKDGDKVGEGNGGKQPAHDDEDHFHEVPLPADAYGAAIFGFVYDARELLSG